MRSQGVVAATVVVLGVLLSGCQATPATDLRDELSGIAGVESVEVDGTRVAATLLDDIVAADAETAILALRDQAVAGHALGDQVELVVVLDAGTRDVGGAQPSEVYSYGAWTLGAVTGDGFGQQAAFLARLADWDTLLTTPAPILHVQFEVAGVDAPAGTPAPEETPAADGTTAAPAVQTRRVSLGQSLAADATTADLDALIAELSGFWVESGGLPDAVTIR